MSTLADGTAMYFGGTIESFALPLAAVIVMVIVLFFLFRSNHPGLKLKYLTTASVNSIATREPGPAPAPPVAAVEVATPKTAAEPETAAKPKSEADKESGE